MSLSASPGSPHSPSEWARRGNAPGDRDSSMGCRPALPPAPPAPHNFLGNYVPGRPDHDFFPLSLAKAVFSVVLLSFTHSPTLLQSFFGYNLQLRISCCRNLRLPGDKVPKTFSHPFLLFQAHFVRIDLEHIWSLFQTEPF